MWKNLLRPSVITPTVAVVSAAAGAGVTYIVVGKKLERKYADLAEEEIRQAREMYAKKYKKDEFTLEGLAQYDRSLDPQAVQEDFEEVHQSALISEAVDILEEQGYKNYSKIGKESTAQTEEERVEVMASQRRNIFETSQPIQENDEYNREAEEAKKLEGKPYILEHDEFYLNENESGGQATLTYYEEDDVLVDEQNRPIPNKDAVVGAGNLRFGISSPQFKDTVLIANPSLNMQYEVVRENSSYTREILGFDPEEDRKLTHRRFRDDD